MFAHKLLIINRYFRMQQITQQTNLPVVSYNLLSQCRIMIFVFLPHRINLILHVFLTDRMVQVRLMGHIPHRGGGGGGGGTHPPTSKSWQLHGQTVEMAGAGLDSSILSPFLSEPDLDNPNAVPPPEGAFGKFLQSLPSKSATASQGCKFVYDHFPSSREILTRHGRLRGLPIP